MLIRLKKLPAINARKKKKDAIGKKYLSDKAGKAYRDAKKAVKDATPVAVADAPAPDPKI